ncbi:MAG: globin [Flavobacteriaceae bacterium CG_4_8_14_3_um_filter_34_10]|nr:MAG: globin [Flavobacteriaceae bacterium CG2_30_34_30]PIV51129.1 MAG: globin [Flavobacteriaceae bacterium CG02_land_8_20_14_3_00_34_13]PIX09492.1 MAG: globin [Flavobacteriaceae bacterium CG_4_8_14_3_um_filter_34_10]
MQDLKNREDVFLLVSSFYAKVRKSEGIGHFFNDTITDWDAHLEKLTDFWESNLFFKAKFKGNPVVTHNRVDKNFHHGIQMEHFGEWINLWLETIDEHFAGELANRAKSNARKMASHLYLNIFEARGL